MGRLTHKYIVEEATCTYASWTNKEILAFHYFNKNGLNAKWTEMCKTGNQWVDAGHVRTGWVMAYGSLSSYAVDRLVELYESKRPRTIDTQVMLEMLQDAIDKGYEKLGEMIMEA